MNEAQAPHFQTPPPLLPPTDLVLKTPDAVEPFDPVKYKSDLLASLLELTTEADRVAVPIAAQAGYELVVAVERRLAAREKQVEGEVETTFCAPARARWQAANALKSEVVKTLTTRREKLADLRTTYRRQEEEKARREQEIEAAAERERQRAADAARAQAEQAQRDKEESDRLERALIAEQSGDHARAEAILDTPAPLEPAPFLAPPPPPPPPMARAVARVEGEIRGKDWTGSVVDRKIFFLALAEGRIPFFDEEGKPIVEVRQGWLNAMAKRHEDRMGSYLPGTTASWKLKSSVRA